MSQDQEHHAHESPPQDEQQKANEFWDSKADEWDEAAGIYRDQVSTHAWDQLRAVFMSLSEEVNA